MGTRTSLVAHLDIVKYVGIERTSDRTGTELGIEVCQPLGGADVDPAAGVARAADVIVLHGLPQQRCEPRGRAAGHARE